MPEYKGQHFVPASYLRSFALDAKRRSIGLYAFSSKRFVARGSIRDQCSRDYFYGKNPETERALSALESWGMSIFQKAQSTNKLQLGAGDLFAISAYLAIQDCRTEYAARSIEVRTRGILEKIRDQASPTLIERFEGFDHLRASMAVGLSMFPMFLDLKTALLRNESADEFVTSDHPVVKRNLSRLPPMLFPSRGAAKSGLVVLLPIGPRHLIMAYDGGVYRLSEKIDGAVRIKSRSAIFSINAAVAADAHQAIYFSSGHSAQSIQSIVDVVEEPRKLPWVDTVELVPGDKPNSYRAMEPDETRPEIGSTVLHSREAVQRTELDVPQLRLRPDPKYFNDGSVACPLRDHAWNTIVQDFSPYAQFGVEGFFAFAVGHPLFDKVGSWKRTFFPRA